ncbi:protein Star-like [Folsomia candida]|nr:protein Star-like [Folsomia candida]XP_035714499.1 protein Star-like [Folsomia candida]
MLLERYFAWSGVLIEGDPRPLKKLTDRNRAAFIAKCCLSTTIRPKVMTFLRHQTGEGLTFIRGKRHFIGGEDKYQPFESQCFPIYAILSALNLTTVDYFSLDIEGAELDVLKTIPWNKVLIKVFSIEVHAAYVTP